MSKDVDNRSQKPQSFEFGEFDLKSKDAKYKRWTPKMDQYLVKLLSDVVHSCASVDEAEMTKKAWSYVCNQLRAANPETVYSTYTKYSCQQHLFHVVHTKYKIWVTLMLYDKNNTHTTGFSYKWNPSGGHFHVVDNSTGLVVHDESQVKALLFGDGLFLPSLSEFNKGNLIVNDFFLSDNLGYISDYHNELLPMLIKLEAKFKNGFEDVYQKVSRFAYEGFNQGFMKPLALHKNKSSKTTPKRPFPDPPNSEVILTYHHLNVPPTEPVSDHHPPPHDLDESVDPALKRRNIQEINHIHSPADFENVLATATIAALNSPPVVHGPNEPPIYIKDRKWFNKLIQLQESGKVSINEVLAVCEGVRDNRIPLVMLNILDPPHDKNNQTIPPINTKDEDIARRLREFMIPMTYIQRQ